MKLKKTIPLVLSLTVMIGVIAFSSSTQGNAPTKSAVNGNNTQTAIATADTASKNEEMRGVWVSYMELTMENENEKSENAFRNKFSEIAKKCKDFGFNTLVVQVRPFCDALYKSEYFPYSHILTGTQGKNPGYDPLKIMCEICRSNKLDIHAWVNPYRISTNETPNKLSEDNPYIEDNSIGTEFESGIYLYPSSEKARKLIIDGVVEIAKNYEVDGIQFDDYFYPTRDKNFDREQYEAYVNQNGEEESMNLDNWRKANVNMLVCETYRALHNTRDDIVFGISPQGNIDNNDEIYADVKAWCTCRGFVDYICPQIYFSLNNPALSFESSLKSWTELEFAENVKLYAGLAGYKAGTDADENTWLENNDILAEEYRILKNEKKTDGFMLYSYSSLESKEAMAEIKCLKEELKAKISENKN